MGGVYIAQAALAGTNDSDLCRGTGSSGSWCSTEVGAIVARYGSTGAGLGTDPSGSISN